MIGKGYYITCNKKGIIKANGIILGESTQTLYFPAEDKVCFEWIPMISDYVPLSFYASFDTDASLPEYIKCVYFKNIADIRLSPKPLHVTPKLIPHIVMRKEYDHAGLKYSFSVYYDGGYIISIEKSIEGKIIFARYIDSDLSNCSFDSSYVGESLYICIKSGEKLIVLEHNISVTLIFEGSGTSELYQGELVIHTSTGDRAGRQKIMRLSPNKGSMYSKMDMKKIVSNEDKVYAFLFSVRHDLFDDASYFLSKNLLSKLTLPDLKEFFGGFAEIFTPSFIPPLPEQTVCTGISSAKAQNIFTGKLYYFDFDMQGKIHNIRE